jgi:pyridoxal phosphate enzyme (YggS family)
MSKETFENIASKIPSDVCLVAVSKTKPSSEIKKLYDLGQRHFGENKVQELVDKYDELPKDINWHLIGHLQSNKVKYIAPFVHLIHAVDSLKLLQEINKQAAKNERVISCLLQFHIATEESKFGLNFEEAKELLESRTFVEMQNISIDGVMGMASNTDNEDQVREEFRNLEGYFNVLKSHFFKYNDKFKEISMGMSGDFKIAIEEGSTMVRVGSAIFGSR